MPVRQAANAARRGFSQQGFLRMLVNGSYKAEKNGTPWSCQAAQPSLDGRGARPMSGVAVISARFHVAGRSGVANSLRGGFMRPATVPVLCRRTKEMMLSTAAPGSAVIESYHAKIKAYCIGGEWEKAVSILRDMKVEGVAPNTSTYNNVIIACGCGNQPEQAVALLREMVTVEGASPDVISYDFAIMACGKASDWEQAIALLEEMPGVGIAPDLLSYNAAMMACAAARQLEKAVGLLREMRDVDGVTPDVASFNLAIMAYEQEGKWEGATGLLNEMQFAGVNPDVTSYNSIIKACAASGEWKKSETYLRKMELVDITPNAVSYRSVIEACMRSGETARAGRLAKEMAKRGIE